MMPQLHTWLRSGRVVSGSHAVLPFVCQKALSLFQTGSLTETLFRKHCFPVIIFLDRKKWHLLSHNLFKETPSYTFFQLVSFSVKSVRFLTYFPLLISFHFQVTVFHGASDAQPAFRQSATGRCALCNCKSPKCCGGSHAPGIQLQHALWSP